MTSAFCHCHHLLRYGGCADVRATGQELTSARFSDFGYLAWCDGCCDDAEDFLLEVLGGES